MANAWKRHRPASLLAPKPLVLLLSSSLLLLIFFLLSSRSSSNPNPSPNTLILHPIIKPFDCYNSPQSHPVIANLVEGLKHPFLYSLSDLGSLPEKPHKNIVRILKGKRFRRPDISATVQEVIEKMRGEGRSGIFVDVGANVGMASFAAAVMGVRVLAFEPVFENLQRICDGLHFNRVGDLVTVFEAAASDRLGNITFHKLVGRLDNIVLFQPPVQSWHSSQMRRLHFKKKGEAPYIIYEEDERLLQASNSSAKEIRDFLQSVGYHECTQHGTDAHCIKK
ncbi:hypothetical protein Acr_13g0011510 [Actinidia rufa]|uniref:S-adenosyl-L-methionine-dependent methyltransferases superfamily protein n=1 Tax=Actinidia rufa TaxID=165716 RepID=A0A7J0FM04_9ERIC|nr:hypothetical protein Acr_13g0011510 [Actinidia rufa]